MRTKSNILFLSIMLSLVLSSCVKEPGEFRAQLNVVALISPGNHFEVIVSKTAPALGDHSNLEVENAEVLIINNQTQEISPLRHTVDGIYSSVVKPLSGLDYEIQVSAPGFESTQAATHIPDLNDVRIQAPEQNEQDENISVTFSADFKENTSTSHFAYELLYIDENNPDVAIPLSEVDAPYVIDVNVKGQSALKPLVGKIGDGSSATIVSLDTSNAIGEPTDINNVSIRIVAVSPQYHAYLMEETSLDSDTHYSSSHYMQDGIFSNFTGNAYGIFGGYNERTVKLLQ